MDAPPRPSMDEKVIKNKTVPRIGDGALGTIGVKDNECVEPPTDAAAGIRDRDDDGGGLCELW